jgi:hypothetical protein
MTLLQSSLQCWPGSAGIFSGGYHDYQAQTRPSIVAWGTKFRVDYALRTGETLTPLAMATATAYAEVTENAIMTALESIDSPRAWVFRDRR